MQLAHLADGHYPPTLAFVSLPGGYEWFVIGAIALLAFGKRLPAAARGIGQSILEFKKGMKDTSEPGESDEPAKQIAGEDAPRARFDPATGKPLDADHTATA